MQRRLFIALTAAFAMPLPVAGQETAWDVLRDGGVVMFRHARAPGTGDPAHFTLGDCATQRNLNDIGRAQSRQIGAAFAERGVTVGAVLHSRWCRSAETAQLAFPDLAEPEPALDSFFSDRSTEPQQTAEVARIIRDWRGPGALVLVSHFVNVRALTGQTTSEGEGIVLRPTSSGFELAGRITP